MNPAVDEIIRDSESRYLTKGEIDKVLAFTAALPQRFACAQAVEAKEEIIVQQTVDQMKRRYPNFERYHPQAWDRAFRDIQLVLRFSAQAMVWDDPTLQEDKLLVWLGTILASFSMTPQFCRDCYSFVRESCRQNLKPDLFATMLPFLEKNIEVLGAIPEPAVAMV